MGIKKNNGRDYRGYQIPFQRLRNGEVTIENEGTETLTEMIMKMMRYCEEYGLDFEECLADMECQLIYDAAGEHDSINRELGVY